MKKVLATCLISIASVSFAKQLTSYQEIEKVIKAGETIVVVTDFSKCETPMPIFGQFSPSAVMLANNSIIFSDNHFTTNNPKFKGKVVNDYVTYKLYNDNIDINTQLISLPDYSIQSAGSNKCLLNEAVKFYTSK